MTSKKIEDLATKEDLANLFKDLKYRFIIWQLIFFLAFNIFLIVLFESLLKTRPQASHKFVAEILMGFKFQV